MKNMLLLAVAGAAASLSSAVLAQDAHRHPHGDGVQTRAEVVQHVRTLFARIDANRDGFITQAEGQAGQARLMAEHGQQGAGGMKGMGARLFAMADANRDNRISLEEATAAANQHFDHADLNRDGRITREERQQMRQHIQHMRHGAPNRG